MIHLLQLSAERAAIPALFAAGLFFVYLTGFILLAAVIMKFIQHYRHPQRLEKQRLHWFSTREMFFFVLILFTCWVRGWGQVSLSAPAQILFGGPAAAGLLFSVGWHLRAKRDIGLLWSDGIEIKQTHPLRTEGAYALARHPMYASLLLWCWCASLLLENALTFILVSVVFLPLMVRRAKAEERWLLQKNPDYALYQNNVRMMTLTLRGGWSVAVRLVLALILCYFTKTRQITPAVLGGLVFLHLYLGYSLKPEKTAFAYRSKSGMMILFGLLGLYVHPAFFCFFYVIAAMCLYGLKWNCPCMWVYEKYHGCPCLTLIKKLRAER